MFLFFNRRFYLDPTCERALKMPDWLGIDFLNKKYIFYVGKKKLQVHFFFFLSLIINKYYLFCFLFFFACFLAETLFIFIKYFLAKKRYRKKRKVQCNIRRKIQFWVFFFLGHMIFFKRLNSSFSCNK